MRSLAAAFAAFDTVDTRARLRRLVPASAPGAVAVGAPDDGR